jgi:hypothetical protein
VLFFLYSTAIGIAAIVLTLIVVARRSQAAASPEATTEPAPER